MRPAGEEKMKEKHKTPQHKTHLCLCSCRVVCCSSTAAAASATHHQDMAALLMQGVVSRGERRRKAMEKKKRIKRMIERKGGLERAEKKGRGVCAAFKD